MSNSRNTRTPSRSTCPSHRAWRNRAALAGALGLGLTCAASTQVLSLDTSGGGIGGSLALRLQGEPGEPYFTLFDLAGQATQVPALANFVVSLQALAGQSQFRVSSLVRATPQLRGTFAPSRRPAASDRWCPQAPRTLAQRRNDAAVGALASARSNTTARTCGRALRIPAVPGADLGGMSLPPTNTCARGSALGEFPA